MNRIGHSLSSCSPSCHHLVTSSIIGHFGSSMTTHLTFWQFVSTELFPSSRTIITTKSPVPQSFFWKPSRQPDRMNNSPANRQDYSPLGFANLENVAINNQQNNHLLQAGSFDPQSFGAKSGSHQPSTINSTLSPLLNQLSLKANANFLSLLFSSF